MKVDRKNQIDGKSMHLVSVAEDGHVLIWDTRMVDKESRRSVAHEIVWRPILNIQLYRTDGTGELGLNRILFDPEQTTTTFWAASDEGDVILVDWSAKPAGGGEEAKKQAEYVKRIYEVERTYRPTVALERSPFFSDILLSVHDFHFCVWKTSLENFDHPIFKSAYAFGSHNTCGCFSPTRAGVIFISKTNGIDVWDFLDQSHRPSMTLGAISSSITYITFQMFKHADKRQFLAFGEESDGTVFLYKVPPNLRSPQGEEEEAMEKFWDREIQKCDYRKQRDKLRKEEQ